MTMIQASDTTGYRRLTGSSLKILAMILMLIDHTGIAILYMVYLLPNAPVIIGTPLHNVYLVYRAMRFVGRSAFPIFCFLLVQGFLHTSDRKKYVFRLGIFALLSELPFDLALYGTVMDWSHQNVFFTLLIGLLVLCLMERFESNPYIQVAAIAAGMGLAWLLKSDYSYHGVLLIAILYFFRYYPVLMTFAGCISLLWEAPACLAFIPINLYNKQRGSNMKYFFYCFYPMHLLLLAGIRSLLIFFGAV
ncbi:conjugal transfer protein TraX [Ruminococcus sp. OA3]|uniref:TraX family protein n=1 Tax=Ruminococcus sp. OA3 TaxID=2914164 RepID=UPI001F06882A|nr:TraX family protein [Ruminococcus sp. OA3]MCH1983209.1 conjugal transfer protein TraX [Ruminococcus sp. OA3]